MRESQLGRPRIKDGRIHRHMAVRLLPEALAELKDMADDCGQSYALTAGILIEEALATRAKND